jgi:hypothetical protein
MQDPTNDSQEKPQESCPRPLTKDRQDQQYRLELKRLRRRGLPPGEQNQPITREQWDALAWEYENRVLSLPHCTHHLRSLFRAKLRFCLAYENAFDPVDRSGFRRAVMAELFPQHVVSKKARLDRAG